MIETLARFEEELESRVRRSETCDRIVSALLTEIEGRFATLAEGELHRDESGWPVSWTWATPDRAHFMQTITKFSSNQAAFFGQLLTPLVNGIRVAGPFQPHWAANGARLVFIDGEGLGHTPGSVAAVSTAMRKHLDEVDAIVLVDNAQQPMQAAPVAVMKTIAATGNGEKLFFLFTHFDLVKGDNLLRFSEREEHVLGSAENVLNAVREELGVAERLLRRRLDDARYFVGGIDRRMDPVRLDPMQMTKAMKRTIGQLNALFEALAEETAPMHVGPVRPVYDRAQLSAAVTDATLEFHRRWHGVLGLEDVPEAPKRHWATIKALTRRLAEGRADEYNDLKPAASLRSQLEFQIYRMVQAPVRWTGPVPDEDEQQILIDTIAGAFTKRMVALTNEVITEGPQNEWVRAYEEHGQGSTFRRAEIVAFEIYERGVPYPDGYSASSEFMERIESAFNEVVRELELIVE